jgi:hypothetical protein
MLVRDLRVRYEVPTAMNSVAVHGVVCTFQTLGVWVRKIKDVGYKLVGVDERYRDEKEWIPLDEGWTEIQKT